MIWRITLWDSWILGVLFDGMTILKSDILFNSPPSEPSKPIVKPPQFFAVLNPLITLSEFPDVEIPNTNN